ncbi:MAG TPA: YqgE/AlgH family protein [Steroidobacteraceae bacterium]|jgi:putative transcriptional regulator|nr:YqgE/AlgH family protein [Steroidobacteraceae bacterium]
MSAGTQPSTHLTNQLLVAMPWFSDPNFEQSVTLICEHSHKGALGIVLNKPLPMKLAEVLAQMHLTPDTEAIGERSVLRGGPVHQDRGFVLHRPGGAWDSTHRISDSIQVTTSRDVLAAIARGEGPADAFIALGYAGWEPGQLEREIKENAWLTLPMDEQLLFDLPYEDRWLAAWRRLGVDVGQVSLFPGHA